MQRLFKETPIFTQRFKELASDVVLVAVQNEILENPLVGTTIAGTGGIRKMRASDPSRGKGKRGGLRVLYLDIPNREITYLLYIYGKDEAEDISSDEKKQFREMVKILKGE